MQSNTQSLLSGVSLTPSLSQTRTISTFLASAAAASKTVEADVLRVEAVGKAAKQEFTEKQ